MQGAWAEFRTDLGAALGVWAKAPALPLLSIAVGLTPAIPNEMARDGNGWFVLLLSILLISLTGWYGTERIWYLRLFRGKRITAKDLVTVTIGFIGPFVRLGAIAFLVLIPLFGLSLLVTPADSWNWVDQLLVSVPVDVLLTFMTPALAFTTRRASEAFNIGIKMLRDEWPRCAWYALMPPLAMLLVVQTLPASSIGFGARLGMWVLTILLNLWFKGATAAYYLRRHEVGDDGSLAETDDLQPVESGAKNL